MTERVWTASTNESGGFVIVQRADRGKIFSLDVNDTPSWAAEKINELIDDVASRQKAKLDGDEYRRAMTENEILRQNLVDRDKRIEELHNHKEAIDADRARLEARVAELEEQARIGDILGLPRPLDDFPLQLVVGFLEPLVDDWWRRQLKQMIAERDDARKDRDAARAAGRRLEEKMASLISEGDELKQLRQHADRLQRIVNGLAYWIVEQSLDRGKIAEKPI